MKTARQSKRISVSWPTAGGAKGSKLPAAETKPDERRRLERLVEAKRRHGRPAIGRQGRDTGGHPGELDLITHGHWPALAPEDPVQGEMQVAPSRSDFERVLVEAADRYAGNRRREHACVARNGPANGELTEDDVARMGNARGIDDDKGFFSDLRAERGVDVETIFDPP